MKKEQAHQFQIIYFAKYCSKYYLKLLTVLRIQIRNENVMQYSREHSMYIRHFYLIKTSVAEPSLLWSAPDFKNVREKFSSGICSEL